MSIVERKGDLSNELLMTSLGEEHKAAKKLERANAAKVLRRFAKLVGTSAFSRRSTFFARESGELIQFLHLHKFTFGPKFRMHICVRVLNDPAASCTLSGTDDRELSSGNSFEYGMDVASINACAEKMAQFVVQYAEPWFEAWSNDRLLSNSSFLRPAVRMALAAHIAGAPDEERIRASRALFYK